MVNMIFIFNNILHLYQKLPDKDSKKPRAQLQQWEKAELLDAVQKENWRFLAVAQS